MLWLYLVHLLLFLEFGISSLIFNSLCSWMIINYSIKQKLYEEASLINCIKSGVTFWAWLLRGSERSECTAKPTWHNDVLHDRMSQFVFVQISLINYIIVIYRPPLLNYCSVLIYIFNNRLQPLFILLLAGEVCWLPFFSGSRAVLRIDAPRGPSGSLKNIGSEPANKEVIM